VFFWAILCYSQSGDDTQDNLAKFGLQAKYENNFSKHPSIFLATYLNNV
jgi:hypothetical protein